MRRRHTGMAVLGGAAFIAVDESTEIIRHKGGGANFGLQGCPRPPRNGAGCAPLTCRH